jgi:hypothetical protein
MPAAISKRFLSGSRGSDADQYPVACEHHAIAEDAEEGQETVKESVSDPIRDSVIRMHERDKRELRELRPVTLRCYWGGRSECAYVVSALMTIRACVAMTDHHDAVHRHHAEKQL